VASAGVVSNWHRVHLDCYHLDTPNRWKPTSIFGNYHFVQMFSSPGRSTRFLCLPELPDQHWDPPRISFGGCRDFFPRVKRSERDGDHSSSSSAEVRNEWSCVSIPLMCHLIVKRAALYFVEMCRLHSLLRHFTLQYPNIVYKGTQIFFQNSRNDIKSLSAKR
jgi:hypothetical protein